MIDTSTLTQVASIIAGFGATALTFRIQREIEMNKLGERNWIPWADRLLIAAIIACLLVVVLVMLFGTRIPVITILSRGLCASSASMLGGWIFGILAHYRLILSKNPKNEKRDNPEPAEKVIVWITIIISVVVFLITFILEEA